MIELHIEHDYLVADADEWLNDVSVPDTELTDTFRATADRLGIAEEYAYTDTVVRVLEAAGLGPVSGIYGEDGPVHVAMCNEETLLDRDLSFLFGHITQDGYTRAVIIMTGSGYWADRLGFVEVRDFIGDDDGDAFGYSRGYVSHDTKTYDECGSEWILDNPVTLWPNGGGTTHRVDDCILPDEEGTPRLVCPDCGDTLTAFVS